MNGDLTRFERKELELLLVDLENIFSNKSIGEEQLQEYEDEINRIKKFLEES